MGSGMSGEGGGNQEAVSILVWSAIAYPVLVFAAFLFKRRKPILVFLPALSLVVGLAAARLI